MQNNPNRTSQYPAVNRTQVIAFRLKRHHLSARMPSRSLLEAAGGVTFQNTPPGATALALLARLQDFKPEHLQAALETDKTLLQCWSLRAAPYIFPTADQAAFTTGLLPDTEEAIRFYISGAEAALDLVNISATQVVELTAAAVKEVLNGRAMTKDELGVELSGWILPRLNKTQQDSWQADSWYAAGQRLGESIVRFALPLTALHGLICHAERLRNKAYFRLTNQWLATGRAASKPGPAVDAAQARSALLQRFLTSNGPSTPRHFAEWAGMAPLQAEKIWGWNESQLAEVNLDGRPGWLLERDLEELLRAETPASVRLLPPHDPYLDLRDRALIVPDPAHQQILWQSTVNPGAVLADGEIAAAWQSQKRGTHLKFVLHSFHPISDPTLTQIEAEAASMAEFRQCSSYEIETGQ